MTTLRRRERLALVRSEVAFDEAFHVGTALRRRPGSLARAIAYLCTLLIVVGGGARAARAQEAATRIGALNKQALDAFDNLNFDQAKTLLEQAIAESEAAGLAKDPVAARSHLNLGMLLIAGFQQRDQAIDHFQIALKIQRDISAPAGLFNPEVQTVFDEVKANLKPEAAPPPARPTSAAPAVRVKSPKAGAPTASEARRPDRAGEDDSDDSGASEDAKFLLSLGLGSGFGVAKGHLDANDGSVQNSAWSGGLAPSRLGHIMLGVGYLLLPRLMLSLDGRIQVVSGTTSVTGTAKCMPSCSAPSSGFALLAKATWFFGDGPLRPFVAGGLGGGTIRQVVTINVVPDPTQPPQGQPTGCGDSGTDTCVDTVTGGPMFFVAGGGLAYEIGSLVLLGSLTANVGVPNAMLNIDALLGVGLRL